MALEFHGKYQLASTHDSTITCVAFSGKGDYIASGGLDWKLLIFSSADGQLHYSVTTPSPIKSLIWLPGSEQVLVCACHNGILINVTILAGVTINFSYFRAEDHIIDLMAFNSRSSGIYLATGAGEDVRIWKGDRRHDWQKLGRLSSPQKCLEHLDADVVLNGLHWRNSATGHGNIKLITTYRYHGIQLWDIEKMAVVQSFSMPSQIFGSSLSPNGLLISTAKLGGYDLYSLDSGMLVNTYKHGLPSGNDKYPATFLPGGRTFCAATANGAVTLWDVEQGDRLQSVRPLPSATIHVIAVYASEKSGAITLATASCDKVIAWHAIPGGVGHRPEYNYRCCSKHHAGVVWTAAIVCVCAILLMPTHAFWPAK